MTGFPDGFCPVILTCCDRPGWGPLTLTRKVSEGRNHLIFILECLGKTLHRMKMRRIYLLAGELGLLVVIEYVLGYGA